MDKLLSDLKKLKDVYVETIEGKVGEELKVKMKLINSEEEAQVHAHASTFEQGLGYLYAIKKETICRAIVGLNGDDIPEYIDSEEKGEFTQVERFSWLKKNVVSGWNQILIDEIYTHYAELVNKLEERIKKDIKSEE